MNEKVKSKLINLVRNFREITGSEFKTFFCPLLLIDEDVDLVLAHIINKTFKDSPRSWTVQRKDVDGFYGRMFESEFTKLDYKYLNFNRQELIFDKELNRKYSPKIIVDDEKVKYFHSDKVPDCKKIYFEDGRSIFIKKDVQEINSKVILDVSFDLRLCALVSLIKAAYLTVFELLGYNYALSPAGKLIGHDLLGRFFIENKNNTKNVVIENSKVVFSNYVNLMRPVEKEFLELKGTSIDGQCLICVENNIFWGMVVFINTSNKFHAVLLPNFETLEGEKIFNRFLNTKDGQFYCKKTIFKNNAWSISRETVPLNWGFKNCTLE